MDLNLDFWKGRRVLLTGHTGFKGSWLAAWLQRLGAQVTGFALPPPSTPSLFELADVASGMQHRIGDVRNSAEVAAAFSASDPEVVLHLAAQPLVRLSYREPIETFDVNVLGTARVLDCARQSKSVRSIVVVTSDKCYENRDWPWPYRENDALGGHDPYSASKACAELVAASYRSSFLQGMIATARAGNVIGGGDFAEDRIVPDIVRAAQRKEAVVVRNPSATRPWQFVLDPLAGYLHLAERLFSRGAEYAAAWNFGPAPDDVQPVRRVATDLCAALGHGASWRPHEAAAAAGPHEAAKLTLDSAKAHQLLGWHPVLPYTEAVRWTAEGYAAHLDGEPLRGVIRRQLDDFEGRVVKSDRLER